MKINSLVSIVVPAYNVENYLERCINSLLTQTYKNVEIIIVDDGSTDKTPIIADAYQTKYRQIKCIHKKNEGLGLARNSGISISNGSYITFVDSDDFLEPSFLEKCISFIDETNADTVITSYYRVFKKEKKAVKRSLNNEKMNNTQIHSNLIPRLLGSLPKKIDTFAMSAWGILYDNQIIKSHCIKFVSERLVGSEDIMFNMKYLSYSNETLLTDYCGYNYCENEDSLTTSYNPNRFMLHKNLYLQEKDLIYSLNLPHNTVLRLDWQFFIHLTMAIKQEINKFGIFSQTTYKHTYKLITDPFLKKILNNYPIHETDLKHRLFLNSVKRKLTFLVCLMVYIKGN